MYVGYHSHESIFLLMPITQCCIVLLEEYRSMQDVPLVIQTKYTDLRMWIWSSVLACKCMCAIFVSSTSRKKQMLARDDLLRTHVVTTLPF